MVRPLSASATMRNAAQASKAQPEFQSDPSLPPMHKYQPFLPPLPVPELEHTIPLYLSTVEPHATPTEYAHTKQLAEDFLRSPLSRTLQQRLLARAEAENAKGQSVQASILGEGGNWLADWWNSYAYTSVRDPVVPWVSYYYVHKDPVVSREEAREGMRVKGRERRAAELVRGAMLFRDLVETAQLSPDTTRTHPLDMSSFRYLFNATRLPHETEDTVRKYDTNGGKEHAHVVFVRGGKFWKLDVGGKGVRELESQIAKIYSLSDSHPTPAEDQVGALTSAPRPFWARARAHLSSLSEGNRRVLEVIDSAAVVVALDEERPVTREEVGWGCWAGGGRGRWFDKHQLIVFDNARSGFLGEHSAMDGTPTLRMNEFILGAIEAGKLAEPSPTSAGSAASASEPEELKWELDDTARSMIVESEKMFEDVMAKHDMRVLHYSAYGTDLIKSHKCSPDAWAQLVMQLAWHMAFSRPGVCYESCQTRKFRRGRTEVIRSASSESKKWAEAMLDPLVSDAERKKLFLAAVKRHLHYASLAANGLGVDRHLLGLKMLLKEGEDHPFLTSDPLMNRTKHWEMSTSQLSSPFIDGWGYAEVVEDGYGLAYALGAGWMRWTVTSQVGGAARMAEWLERAAGDVRGMMERAARDEEEQQQATNEKAKL